MGKYPRCAYGSSPKPLQMPPSCTHNKIAQHTNSDDDDGESAVPLNDSDAYCTLLDACGQPTYRACAASLAVGTEVAVTRFKAGQLVDVYGLSKGKGFHGVMRKHNFAGQADAHGSTTHRRNGAIGCRSTPGRVYKNAGMPGHLGLDNCTIQNLKVMQVREGEKLILVRGAIPGANGSVVIVRDAKKVAVKA